MKIFFLRTLLFSCSLIFSWVVVYLVYVQRNIVTENLDFNKYIIGDSRSHTIKNKIEDYGYFNFSSRGDSYLDMYRKINFLVKRIELKTILLQIDDHNFSQYRDDMNNNYISINYTDYDDYKNYLLYYFHKYIEPSIFDPRLKDIVKNYFNNIWAEYFEYIFYFLNATTIPKKNEINLNDKLSKRFQLHYGRGKSLSLEKQLEKILNICEIKNIEIIGVKYPVRGDYLSMIQRLDFNQNSIKLNGKYKILDYSKIFKSKPHYFKDQDHLNELGTLEFLTILKNDLKNIKSNSLTQPK